MCTTAATIMSMRLNHSTIRIPRSAAVVMSHHHHNCFSILGRQGQDESTGKEGLSPGDKDSAIGVKPSIIETSGPSTRGDSDTDGMLLNNSIDEIQPEWLALERRLILRKPKIRGIVPYRILI